MTKLLVNLDSEGEFFCIFCQKRALGSLVTDTLVWLQCPECKKETYILWYKRWRYPTQKEIDTIKEENEIE